MSRVRLTPEGIQSFLELLELLKLLKLLELLA
jgi:hypothetical protein